MVYSLYLTSLVISLVIALALTGFFWYRRPAPGATAATGLTAAVVICLIAYILEQLRVGLAVSQLVDDFLYIGLVSGPVFWLIFILLYVRSESWIRHHLYLLWVIPGITLVLTLTNSLHHLVWSGKQIEAYFGLWIVTKTYGPWFIVHTVYSYSLGIAGLIILTMRSLSPIRLYRNQLILLSICLLVPFIWNILYLLRAPPAYKIDLTPQAFIITGLVMTLGLFRFKLLDIIPVARSTLMENLSDGILVLDQQNRVVDVNQSAQKMLGHPASEIIGQPPNLIWKKYPEIKSFFEAVTAVRTEMVWDNSQRRNYELSIIPLNSKKQELNGRLVILHDMTENKQMEQALKNYARRITQVQEEERKLIAYELHDDTAQYLAILKLQLDSILNSGKIEDPGILKKLEYLEKDAGRAVDDVRRYSHELRPGVLDHLGLHAALEQIAEDINKLEQIRVEVDVEGEEPPIPDEVKLGLFRIAQEALSNARKHAKVKMASISLIYQNNKIDIIIRDNGIGFDVKEAITRSSLKGSLGLMSMHERAKLIGAELKIESKPGQGTIIRVEKILNNGQLISSGQNDT